MANFLWAVLSGATLAFIGTMLHNAISPIGLLLALAVTAIGIWYVGQIFNFRKYKIVATVSWIIVVSIAASSGSGGEVLILGNRNGNIFLLTGALLATVVALIKS